MPYPEASWKRGKLEDACRRARGQGRNHKFRKLGFIHYNGGIQVHSSLLNLVLHEEPHIETEVCHFSSARELLR